MSALFLLKAAKKCDAVFKVSPKSTSHSIADSKADVNKIQQQLQEKGVTKEDISRRGQEKQFTDPTDCGLSTLTNGDWLSKQLQSKFEHAEDLQCEQRGEVDLDYELADTQ